MQHSHLSDQDHAAASALHSLSSPPSHQTEDYNLNNNNHFLPTSPTSPVSSHLPNQSNQAVMPSSTSKQKRRNDSNSIPPPPPPAPKSKKDKGKEKAKSRQSSVSTERDQLQLEVKSEDHSLGNAADADGSNKRKKASRACVHCQKSHLTCEDARPCSRCVKRGMADTCQDGVRKKAKYLLSEEELAELNARKAAEKLEKAASGGGSSTPTASKGKGRASISSTSSDATNSNTRPRQIKRNSSNRSMLSNSAISSSNPIETSTSGGGGGIGLLATSPAIDDDSELPSNANDLSTDYNHGNQNLHRKSINNNLEGSNNVNNNNNSTSQSQSRPIGNFQRFDSTPYTFGSEATSLEYSMLSSMLNDIDPSLIGGNGNGTPDWNQLSPHTHYSENSDEYRLNRYDGVAAPSGLNPASVSGTGMGMSGGQVKGQGQGEGFEHEGVIGSDEAMNGFTNWNTEGNSSSNNGNQEEINNRINSSTSTSNNRRSSRSSRNRNNNNHFLPSLTSLSNSDPQSQSGSGTGTGSGSQLKNSTIPTSLLTSMNQELNQNQEEEEREPTSAALTDSQVRARHASVFDPDPHSMSASAWKERVGKVYSQKIKPFPYTEGYHFLLKHCTENFEKADVLRIVRALAVFRPSLIALQMPLTEEDEIFVERSLQRTVLELEKLISFSGTPTVVWRRTCEICVVGAEFSMLTQWSREHLLGRFIYQFLDKESSINYWETFALHAFDAGRQSVMLKCTLVTPSGKLVPCSACFSIKRDIFDLPSLIVGNFLPILS